MDAKCVPKVQEEKSRKQLENFWYRYFSPLRSWLKFRRSDNTSKEEALTQWTGPAPPRGPHSGLGPASEPFEAPIGRRSICEEGDSDETLIQLGRENDLNPPVESFELEPRRKPYLREDLRDQHCHEGGRHRDLHLRQRQGWFTNCAKWATATGP